MLRSYTELEIEHLAWKLLRSEPKVRSRLPIDVELLVESQPNLVLRIVPGLVARFSIECCVVRGGRADERVVWVDKLVADSRPLSHYRQLLAELLGHLALHEAVLDQTDSSEDYLAIRNSPQWERIERDARRFAVSIMAPEEMVIQAAEEIYPGLVTQPGMQSPDAIQRLMRNCLAQAFSISTQQIHRRMVRWPCQIYARVEASLAIGSSQLVALPNSPATADDQRVLFGVN